MDVRGPCISCSDRVVFDLMDANSKDISYQIKVIRPVLDRCEDTGMLGAKSDNIQYISAMSDDAAQGRSRSKTGLITLIWYYIGRSKWDDQNRWVSFNWFTTCEPIVL